MLKVALTESQLSLFLKGRDLSKKSVSFLRSVFVDLDDVSSASREAGFSVGRGYQICTSFQEIVNTYAHDNELSLGITLVPNKPN